MSSAVAEMTSNAAGSAAADRAQELVVTERGRGPLLWLASVIGWVMSPGSRSHRGITTIEYIFGAILAIAIVTVVVSVLHNDATATLFQKLIEWALKMRPGGN